MKWQEAYSGGHKELMAYLRDIANKIAGDTLSVEGKDVHVPVDADLEFSQKYSEAEGEAKLTIKVVWPVES